MDEASIESTSALDPLLDRVERGEEIIIMRLGRPVARLVPNQVPADREADAREAFARLRARAAALHAGPFDWEEWKAYRDEGRR